MNTHFVLQFSICCTGLKVVTQENSVALCAATRLIHLRDRLLLEAHGFPSTLIREEDKLPFHDLRELGDLRLGDLTFENVTLSKLKSLPHLIYE